VKLYRELAEWWPLFSPPGDDYAEEAAFVRRLLDEAGGGPIRTLLELGSGGGNNASHLKAHYTLTLVDLSPDMLRVSRRLNPECEHAEGDMRSVRLGRVFDAVFVHDAIGYLNREADLGAALVTAGVHCRPGGVAVFAPDYVRETFRPGTESGGEDDADGRGVRYLEWVHDPDPADATYVADYVLALRDASGDVRVVHDRHIEGVFPRASWLRLLAAAGFEARVVHDPWGRDLFVCRRLSGAPAS
jgi:SAM-dependent methyltransferase